MSRSIIFSLIVALCPLSTSAAEALSPAELDFQNLQMPISASSLGLFTGPDQMGRLNDVYWVERADENDGWLLRRYQTHDQTLRSYAIPASVGLPRDYTISRE
ncbi:MAG TPA: hypothetical protein VF184_01060, partial [Phycisphaeraceae bacterium]